MRLIDDLADARVERPTIVTIGSFDGLHIGHQRVIQQLIAHAREAGRLSAVVTFHPHPRAVLRPWLSPKVLTTPGEKAVVLAELGLDLLVLLSFSRDMAHTPAPDFVRTLCERLRMAELWVGPDFALGRGREGDVPALQAMGQHLGFEVKVLEPILADGRPISSTWVRELLATGQVGEARRLLGRPYSLAGEVVSGARRGRCLGFPTANLAVRPERALPPDGVYAVYAIVGKHRLPAVANVGERPSFNTGQHAIEVHILDYAGNLYGRDLVIEFISRLRPEQRFDDVCKLIEQISHDVERARSIFAAEAEEAREHDGQRIS
ncbi:MAG TPA: bifunctional riboflavin kinase/FAD synthetase [Anaerolineae bacterium]|nr:bifunctional riboflavin kinase/FAD synthetase [Anaerolineae bacterium]HPL29862.1 bifunctional riboflavin kinase/FAD synthetase [Anaerolineae bacterium]